MAAVSLREKAFVRYSSICKAMIGDYKESFEAFSLVIAFP